MVLNVLGFILVHLLLAIYEKFMFTMRDRINKNRKGAGLKELKLDTHDVVHVIFRNVIVLLILGYDIFAVIPYHNHPETQQGSLFFLLLGSSIFLIIIFLAVELILVAFDLMVALNELLSKNLIGKSYEDLLVSFVNKKISKKQENKDVKANSNSSLV